MELKCIFFILCIIFCFFSFHKCNHLKHMYYSSLVSCLILLNERVNTLTAHVDPSLQSSSPCRIWYRSFWLTGEISAHRTSIDVVIICDYFNPLLSFLSMFICFACVLTPSFRFSRNNLDRAWFFPACFLQLQLLADFCLFLPILDAPE